ncbi:MAG: metallophosphoesterase [Bacteroidales bacterium]|nr:metallophosphoesterase [Bacteroidales bacterium]
MMMKIFEYNEAKQVVVCGDIYGAFETIVFKVCVQYGMTDTLIIVAGDCGFGFERPNHYINLYNGLADRLKKANNWIVFVRGNHDDPSYFQEEKICYERFRCVPDYSVIQACGLDILCVGGGVSIDRLACQRDDARYGAERELRNSSQDHQDCNPSRTICCCQRNQ